MVNGEGRLGAGMQRCCHSYSLHQNTRDTPLQQLIFCMHEAHLKFTQSYMSVEFSPAQLFATPWTVARQAPLSMGFSRQECWSGLPCPPPGDLPDLVVKPESSEFAGRFFTTSATWEAQGTMN